MLRLRGGPVRGGVPEMGAGLRCRRTSPGWRKTRAALERTQTCLQPLALETTTHRRRANKGMQCRRLRWPHGTKCWAEAGPEAQAEAGAAPQRVSQKVGVRD